MPLLTVRRAHGDKITIALREMALREMENTERHESTSFPRSVSDSHVIQAELNSSKSTSSAKAVPAHSLKTDSPKADCREIGLHQLAKGASARISSVSSCNHPICHKLLSMGIVEGQIVTLKGIAPLGDPIQIEALGYNLSLRKCEAAHVKVIPLDAAALLD